MLYALILVLGQQPWCTTDGYSFECYYFNPARCEAAAERSISSWCERNPKIYQTPRKQQELQWWEYYPEAPHE